MKRLLATLTLTIAPLVMSPPANAATMGTVTQTFSTALTPQYYGAGQYEGVLHLVIGRDGTVSGWYRPVDDGASHTIVGGLDGDKIWLDLGRGARLLAVNGTYDDGKIVGTTYFGGQPYTFTANVAADSP